MEAGVGRLVRMARPKEPGAAKQSKSRAAIGTATPKRLERIRKLELLEQARNQLWHALPEITAALVEGARAGGVQHLKLLMELGVLERGILNNKGTKRKEKSLEAMLMEQWQLDKQERAAAGGADGADGADGDGADGDGADGDGAG